MHTLKKVARPDWLRNLLFLVQASLLLSTSAARIHAQGGRPSATDAARQIERQEMDQQLLLAPLPPNKKSESARLLIQKQIREDFREVQNSDNKMMANAWAKDELDYSSISDSISQIKSKAIRLRSNLSLPKPEKQNEEKLVDLSAASVKDFRAALLKLDKSIMNFVTNPLFKDSAVVEMDLANRASHDLQMVIDQSELLQKAARSLTKKSKDTHQ